MTHRVTIVTKVIVTSLAAVRAYALVTSFTRHFNLTPTCIYDKIGVSSKTTCQHAVHVRLPQEDGTKTLARHTKVTQIADFGARNP